ncbi:MAG: ABC transporter permease, partial [Actinomycetota bacterium]
RTIPISLQLLIYSQILALGIAIPGSLIGAQFRGRLPDVTFRAVGMLGLAIPVFVMSFLLIITLGLGGFEFFGRSWGVAILPTGRYRPVGAGLWEHIRSMAMPSLALALGTAATYLVLLRGELIQQLHQDHVQLARAKGLSPARIVRVHAMRPAAPSLVAAVGAQSGLVLGNLLIVERIFLVPGFGDYVLVAIGRRDVAAVAGSLFVIAAILAVINLFADAILLAVDPRIE